MKECIFTQDFFSMKHLYIFLSCFLFLQINFSFAQTNVYQPFPNDSAVWYYQFQNTPSSQYYLKELLGDTMINALTYKKEYYQQWNPNINFHYIGGIRQDIPNEKIYYINLSGVEHDISVNQHLMVGDIFPGGNDTIVSIDSVLVGTKYHKQYNYRDSTNRAFYVKGSYIVGVGTSGWGGPESDTILWCFSVNNVLLYHLPPSPSLCPSLLLSVNEEKINENYIFISPNPTNGKFTIQMDNG